MSSSIAEWISAGSDVAQSLAVLVGLYLAYKGFDQWKRQHNWTRNSELAEETMLSVNAYRHAVARIRNPFGYVGEGSTRVSGEGESDQRKQHLDSAFTTIERISKEERVLSRYWDADARCRVRFGSRVTPYLDAIRDVQRDIVRAARMRFEDALHEYPLDDAEINKDRKEMRQIYWDRGTDQVPDDIQKRINDAMKGLETALKAYVHEAP